MPDFQNNLKQTLEKALKQGLILLLLLLLLVPAQAAFARRRSVYNDDYILLREQDGKNMHLDQLVKKATKEASVNPEKAVFMSRLSELEQERAALNAQVIATRKKELVLIRDIGAYSRQKKNDGFRIKALQRQLDLMKKP